MRMLVQRPKLGSYVPKQPYNQLYRSLYRDKNRFEQHVMIGKKISTNHLLPHIRALPSNSNNHPNAPENSDINDIKMRPLDDFPDSSMQKNESSSKDDTSQRQNILQRIAFSIAGLFASLPRWIRAPWSQFNVRVLRLFIFFAIGSILSLLGALGTARKGTSHSSPLPQEVVYSEFLHLVNSGNVRAVRFEDGTGRILFDLKPKQGAQVSSLPNSLAKTNSKNNLNHNNLNQVGNQEATVTVPKSGFGSSIPRQFCTRHIPDPQLIPAMTAAGVEFGSVKQSFKSALFRVIGTALALWLPLIPMFIIMRKFLEGRNGSGKKPKSNAQSSTPPTTFADVAGVGPAKEELLEVVACLRDSKRFAKLGAKLPSGVLLCGPPGTGKTLLARAVAGEAGVPFISVSASEFVELFVGRGAARVRELFAEARKRSPCVVFIDELDAVGGKRGAGLNEERDQTLNQMLTELDGFDGRPGVLLLAATNRPEVLDPALLRPGRLSRRVNVPLPDEEGRAAIAQVHLRKVPIEGGQEAVSVAAALVARLSAGFSGAELANVVNEAAFLAARRDSEVIALGDLVDAVTRTRYGVGGSPGGAWSRKLRDWIVDTAGSGKQVRTQPLGS